VPVVPASNYATRVSNECGKLRLCHCIAAPAILDLSLPQHVHRFVARNRMNRATEGTEVLFGVRPPLNASMVLLNQVVFRMRAPQSA
jgi:hypothetical protein